jgi:hypothetical protein
MKMFSERISEDRRIIILRALEASAGYESNESLLTMILRDFGHAVTRDQTRSEVTWLEENGLLTCEEIGGVMIATLTQRGSETAQGIVVTPGVKRPSPRS